jgi:proton-translocating NADH-quinone oxidoreductase chain L
LIATLLPLASFALLLFVGKRVGEPLAGVVGTLFIAGSLGCSLTAMAMWLNVSPSSAYGAGQGPMVLMAPWIPAGAGIAQDHAGFLDVGLYIDSLTIALFATITMVAALVHIFSLRYMLEDERFARFFTYLSLFSFAMLGLVIAGTMLQIFIFWELVGLCSYLLIGFWFERPPVANAAFKAFVVNRIGDMGFLIGFGILFYHLGNASLPQMWVNLGGAGSLASGGALHLPGGITFSYGALTAMGLCFFAGAAGKSAQFPLHTWLPDAMEGPSPVSALIHSATMVAAGVYLMARIYPLLTPDARLVIAIIGTITLAIGALIALVQTDIKRVLAYSTISQLGYMMLAIGIGSWVGALFHLITHAFFKSLLFLGAGSVGSSTHHEHDMRRYGGLYKRLPITAFAFAIGVLAIAGTPFLSGYFSKSMILTHAAAFGLAHHGGLGWLFFIIPTLVAYLTAFYMTRCWMLTFAGRPRDRYLHESAQESWVLYTPMLGMVVMAIMAGRYLGVEYLLTRSVVEAQRYSQVVSPDQPFSGFDSTWPVLSLTDSKSLAEADPHAMPLSEKPEADATETTLHQAHGIETAWAYWAFALGIGLAIAIYSRGFAIADRLVAFGPLRWVHRWLFRGMYFDELYDFLFAKGARIISFVVALFDRVIVDGMVHLKGQMVVRLARFTAWMDDTLVEGAVSGTVMVAQDMGAAARSPQTGRIRVYVTALLLMLACGLAAATIVMLR